MPQRAPRTARLRVLEIHRPPAPRVRYVDQVVGEGQSGIEYRFGGIRAVERDDVDVVHFHRLNRLLGHRGSAPKRLARTIVFAALVKRRRIALVRTTHGPRPGGWFGRLSNWILDRVTNSFIVVDETAEVPPHRPATLIPHSHYRDRFLGYPRAEQVSGRVLCIPPVQPGRDLEGPLRDVALAGEPGFSLRVVGATPPGLAARTERSAATAPSDALVEWVSDGALVMEISAAELVVLPRVTELEDLSLLLLALSLDRPVLVPDSKAMRLLSDEVGAPWVSRYPGTLTADTLDGAVRALRKNPPAGRPNLDGRDPAEISARYAAVFEAAAAKVRRRGRR